MPTYRSPERHLSHIPQMNPPAASPVESRRYLHGASRRGEGEVRNKGTTNKGAKSAGTGKMEWRQPVPFKSTWCFLMGGFLCQEKPTLGDLIM